MFRDNEGEEEEFDIDLDEFTDEIEPWVIDELKRVGCDTGAFRTRPHSGRTRKAHRPGKETITEVEGSSRKNLTENNYFRITVQVHHIH